MLNRQRGLALAFCLIVVFLLIRQTSSPSKTPSWGSARSKIKETIPDSTTDTPQLKSNNLRTKTANSNHQKTLTDIATKPLRQRLEYYFPYDPTASKFPGYIWQTWKTTPASPDFSEDFRGREASWTEKHPGFVHEVLTDDNARYVLRHLYSAVPDVVAAYEALPRPVLKADFFRYLILLARGGIYTDIDTMAIRSTVEWVPANVPRSAYGLVVGIEADPDRPDWADWYSRRIQFCQWTIQAKAGHPVLREIVATITEKTLAKKRNGTLSHDDVHGVVEFTGPAVWTDVIFNYFNDPEYFEMSEAAIESAAKIGSGKDGFAGRAGDLDEIANGTITWKEFTAMTKARKVGDVVVLPITCFSPGIETMGAGNDEDEMAMVKHFFDGTWKPENERHIGEVVV